MRKNKNRSNASYKEIFEIRINGILILKFMFPIIIGLITFWHSEGDFRIFLSISHALLTVLILVTYEYIIRLSKNKAEVENNLEYIKDSISDIVSVQPFDVINRIKNFDKGRIDPSQESIIDLIGDLYRELLIEGRHERAIHVQAIRYLFINDKIKEFIAQIRHGISEGSLTFRGPDSINITKTLYSLDGSEIDAISYPSLEFWNSIQGKSFLQRNRRSLARGVIIRRYFVVNDTSSIEEISELCESLQLHLKFKSEYRFENYHIYLVRKFKRAEINSILGSESELKFSQIPGKVETQEIPDASLISNNVISIWNFGADESDLDEVRLIFKKNTVDKVVNLFQFFEKRKIELQFELTVENILEAYSIS